MNVDAILAPSTLSGVPEVARAAEAFGFDALWCPETSHDPFLPGVLIAEHTRYLHFGTAIAVSFARSPTTLAYLAWDLAQFSQGRFLLGLGTQVKAHIERRFGMPWPDSVVGKLREQIQAIRSLWRCWQEGSELNYRGRYHRLTLMSPFFNPGPIPHPDIPILIAGVNPGLARLAGEEADGFFVHPLHSIDYLAQVLLPAIRLGFTKRERENPRFQLCVMAFTATSKQEAQFVRAQIAFYASTPSYRRVLEHHGWGEVGEKLSALASRARWEEMPALIDETMLETFAVLGEEQSLAEKLRRRYAGLVQRLSLYLPFVPGQRDNFWRRLVEELRTA
ncbi:MAG: TIGR03617 family F420-dependent LLM class oxidoreductase [Anaerolineales bacterium]|nr:TIGR03617 family F420-dependent LLM class oxidoreductase [Anaerolineales bacterium]MCS7247664.1 TIGR03617 family F420-dependent LLM class oxidoreductase [Anaerolineales bacterium]MDW8161474.1 TIGR03617 family F420-dependent LLM class oxidoreductase [Anaerolineales bacterium]MDW8446893.1 TIGR03617 family F420-dependent LLM class oxidoreductase [Anaerolineales bacterium]